jgi:hypothetical protein
VGLAVVFLHGPAKGDRVRSEALFLELAQAVAKGVSRPESPTMSSRCVCGRMCRGRARAKHEHDAGLPKFVQDHRRLLNYRSLARLERLVRRAAEYREDNKGRAIARAVRSMRWA